MKAVEIQAFGSPEGLAVIDLPDPSPADGQVLIATEAIGVGGVDAVIRSGAIAGYGFKEGHILGSEVAGTVTAVGDGVDTSWVGQRLWAFTGLGGGYVEQAIAPAGEILPLPANLSAVDAVTLGSSGLVAHFGLAHARFAPGESVTAALALLLLVSTEYGAQIFPASVGHPGYPAGGRGSPRGGAAPSPPGWLTGGWGRRGPERPGQCGDKGTGARPCLGVDERT